MNYRPIEKKNFILNFIFFLANYLLNSRNTDFGVNLGTNPKICRGAEIIDYLYNFNK